MSRNIRLFCNCREKTVAKSDYPDWPWLSLPQYCINCKYTICMEEEKEEVLEKEE